jgi:hypothetical protein
VTKVAKNPQDRMVPMNDLINAFDGLEEEQQGVSEIAAGR